MQTRNTQINTTDEHHQLDAKLHYSVILKNSRFGVTLMSYNSSFIM